MRNQGLDVAGATAMLRQWLFKDDVTQPLSVAASITATDVTGDA
jgi:hypothetical protein